MYVNSSNNGWLLMELIKIWLEYYLKNDLEAKIDALLVNFPDIDVVVMGFLWLGK